MLLILKNNNQKILPIAELGQYQYSELLCSARVTPAPVALLGCFSPFFLLLKCDSAEECRMHVSELMQYKEYQSYFAWIEAIPKSV